MLMIITKMKTQAEKSHRDRVKGKCRSPTWVPGENGLRMDWGICGVSAANTYGEKGEEKI